MMIHSVLCVVMFVSRMETLTLTVKNKSLLHHAEKFLNQEEKLLMSRTDKSLSDKDRAEIEPFEDFPVEAVQIALSRSKRQVLEHNKCPSGKVKLRDFCVTCAEYEESTDKDCPIEQQNEIYDDY